MPGMVQRDLFAGRTGSALEVRAGDETVALRIDGLEDFGSADGTRFSVFLSGPGERFLPQGIYSMAPPGGEAFDVFIVPVGREGDRYRYEAAFNREGS